jgi:hypothetical protein
MHYVCIHTVDSWRKGTAQYDCIFVETDSDAPGMHGLDIAHISLFFSFAYDGISICVLSCTSSHMWLNQQIEAPGCVL